MTQAWYNICLQNARLYVLWLSQLSSVPLFNPFPLRSEVKMAFATSIKPEQPASNSQSILVLCCLLLISALGLEMKPLKLESSKKGLLFII